MSSGQDSTSLFQISLTLVKALVDVAVQGLLVVVDGLLDVAFLLALLGEELDDVGFLVVDLDEALPDGPDLVLAVVVLVALGQGAQGVAVLAVVEDALAEELDDVPALVVGEEVDQGDHAGVVDLLAHEGDDAGDVEGDDGRLGVGEVLVAGGLELVGDAFLGGFADDGVELLELIDGIGAQGGPGPLLLVEHLLDFFVTCESAICFSSLTPYTA